MIILKDWKFSCFANGHVVRGMGQVYTHDSVLNVFNETGGVAEMEKKLCSVCGGFSFFQIYRRCESETGISPT